jgi:hypothetical protein
MTTLCINSDNIIYLIVIGFILFHSYRYNSLYPKLFKLIEDKQKNESKKQNLQPIIQSRLQEINLEKELEQRDLEVIHDLSKAPERRVPKHQYLSTEDRKKINIPTRGYPDRYQMLGVLSRESDEKMLNLFGRQTYPGSDIWEYYVSDTTTNIPIKIPININNNRELLEDTIINIPVFDSSKGKFKLTLYKYDTPRYLP